MLVLIKLTVVLCAMLNLTLTNGELSCEKRAYNLMQNCTGVADLTNCLRDKLSEMGGCDEAEQLLGLAPKVVAQTCEQKAEGIKSRCQGSADSTECIRNQLPDMDGCDDAEQLLGLPEKPKSCEERAEEIKVKCLASHHKLKCLLDESAQVMDCADEVKISILEGIQPQYVDMTCDGKSHHLVSICKKAAVYVDCVGRKMPLLIGCRELGRFQNMEEGHLKLSEGWYENTCEQRAVYIRQTCGDIESPENEAQCARDTMAYLFHCREAGRLLGIETTSSETTSSSTMDAQEE